MFSILIYAGINRQLRDKLHVHNVVFARDFRGNIDDIFSGKMPDDPSLYLYFPSVEDEALALQRSDRDVCLNASP